jgi:predicted metalloprotease with PDZ domain
VELGPFNYKEENYTNMLWLAEGFTNYYGYNLLFRAGLVDEKEYFRHLTENVRYYETMPGGRKTSAYESSFDTWIKLYKPSPNNYNNYVSYYLKGELIGFMLDLKLIEVTRGQKSLDDLFVYLMEKYNRDGRGYNEKDLLQALREVSGYDFTEFFSMNIRKAGQIDFAAEFRKIGMVLAKGFKRIDDMEPAERPYLGLILKNSGSKFVVDGVIEGTPAESSGLTAGDELISVNSSRFSERFAKDIMEGGRKVKLDNMSDFLGNESVKVHCFRAGTLRDLDVPLVQSPFEYYEARTDPTPLPDSERNRKKFISR